MTDHFNFLISDACKARLLSCQREDRLVENALRFVIVAALCCAVGFVLGAS